MNTIAFPGLSIGPFTISESINIFGLNIHWYGIIIAFGIVVAYLFCSRMAKNYDLDSETLLDVVLVGLPAAIVGARLYYVIFEWNEYKDNLLSIFQIWNGGLAIYCGVIGALISTYFYCKIKKIKMTKILDTCSFGFLIGQMIGRWGNFVNAEAYGSPTNLPWGMEISGECVHPTFLYESLWNLAIFLILVFIYRKRQKFSGEMFLAYIAGYGLGRLWIEGLRTDSLWLGPIRVSQLVALLCFIGGISAIIFFRRKAKTTTNITENIESEEVTSEQENNEENK